jgi:hypothetical protein
MFDKFKKNLKYAKLFVILALVAIAFMVVNIVIANLKVIVIFTLVAVAAIWVAKKLGIITDGKS